MQLVDRSLSRAQVALTSVAVVLAAAAPSAFAQFNTNLIVNPGAESAVGGNGSFVANLPGWAITGELTGVAYSLGCPAGYACTFPTNSGPTDPGLNQFAGGNVVLSTARQTIDLSFAASELAANGLAFNLSGWLGGFASQDDNATLAVTFLSASSATLGSFTLGPVTAAERNSVTGLQFRSAVGDVPVGTTTASIELTATRLAGTANDGYADNLSFVVNTVSAVPEPETYALLLAGLLVVGVAARRCKSA